MCKVHISEISKGKKLIMRGKRGANAWLGRLEGTVKKSHRENWLKVGILIIPSPPRYPSGPYSYKLSQWMFWASALSTLIWL